MKKSIILSISIIFLMGVNVKAQSCSKGIETAKKIFKTGSYNSSLLPLGPRFLGLGSENMERGALLNGTMRTFVTNPSKKGNVVIDIFKMDSEGKIKLSFCSLSKTGVVKTLKTGKISSRNKFRVKCGGMKNKILIVALKSTNPLVRIDYAIEQVKL